jgi:hypothetical protein
MTLTLTIRKWSCSRPWKNPVRITRFPHFLIVIVRRVFIQLDWY